MKPIELAPEARDEVREAATWYDEQRAGLGEEFLEELERLFSRMSQLPRAGTGRHDQPAGERVLVTHDGANEIASVGLDLGASWGEVEAGLDQLATHARAVDERRRVFQRAHPMVHAANTLHPWDGTHRCVRRSQPWSASCKWWMPR